ncbi:MAG: ImmA/IrrE family metallo-endopeptidase, partial [Magnetococcales bacterium]|nr:ImmA/IrrE family metallo-endopeptidase [Magnetococcales bacterium]
MNVAPHGPLEWATYINRILDQAFGLERYPVSVVEVAMEVTPRLFPDDAVTAVQGVVLDGVDGILAPDPRGQKGWGIFFNSAVPNRRRIRFTLGHELGHYFLHRKNHPGGFRCGDRERPSPDRTSRLEEDADIFSANFLMPPEDFIRQVPAEELTNLSMLSFCADRYGVSLQASVRQWLRLTTRRAVLVLSQDGFIVWSEASPAARRTGRFFQSRRQAIEVPTASLAANPELTTYPREG